MRTMETVTQMRFIIKRLQNHLQKTYIHTAHTVNRLSCHSKEKEKTELQINIVWGGEVISITESF